MKTLLEIFCPDFEPTEEEKDMTSPEAREAIEIAEEEFAHPAAERDRLREAAQAAVDAATVRYGDTRYTGIPNELFAALRAALAAEDGGAAAGGEE